MHAAHQVHVQHQPEIFQGALGETLVTQDAGVVDQDIDPAPLVHGLLDHGLDLVVGDIGAVGDGLATGCTNLGDHIVGVLQFAARVRKIVNQYFRAAFGECQRVAAAEPAACAGNDGYLAIHSDSHIYSLDK